MAYKFNPLSGQIEDQSQGVQGPTGSVAAATDGSAASPSITFTNDSGTGLFRNGNTLGVAGNNASGFQGELLSVRGSHSIKLSGDSIANTFYIVTDANDSILSINGGSSAQHSDSSYINLHGKSSSNGKIKIVAANPSSGTKGNIQFWTGGTQRLTIDNMGRLLVGTTVEGANTANNLTIGSSGNTGMTIRSGNLNEGNIFFSDGTASDAEYRGMIRYEHNNDAFRFTTATVERLRITADGKVGIGTAIPATNFVVSNSGAEGLEIGNTSGTVELNAYNRSTSARCPIDIVGQTFKVLTGNPTLSGGLFQNSDGKVGIGTSAPTSHLHVKAASQDNNYGLIQGETTNNTTRCQLHLTGKTSGGNDVKIVLGGDGDGSKGNLYTKTNHPLGFATNNAAPQMVLDTSGNVGIGTTTPDVTFHVETGSATSTRISGNRGNADNLHIGNIEFENTFNTQGVIAEIRAITGSSGTQSDQGQLAFYTDDGSSLTEQMRIDSSGNVGIGTTSPSRELSIHSPDSGSTYINLTNSETEEGAQKGFGIGLGGDESAKVWNYENTYMQLGTNNLPRIHINADGKVGIGTLAPTGTLEIKSTTDNDKMLRFDMERSWSFIKEGTGLNTRLELNAESGGKWFDITNENRYKTASFFTDYTNSQIHLCPDGGNVGIGTTTPSARLYVNGTQNGLQARFGGAGTGLGISLGQKTNPNALVTFQAQDSTYGTFRFVKGTSTEQLRIDADGKVGIGTATPSHNLSIVGGSNSQLQVKGGEADLWLTSTGSGSEKSWRIFGSTGGSTHKFRIYDGVNDREPFSIDNAGDVAFSDNVTLAESKNLKFGDGNFKLFRTSSNNYINSQTGSLYIQAGGNTAVEVKSTKDVDFSGDVTCKVVGGATPANLKVSSGSTWGLKANAVSGTNAYGLDIYKGSAGTDVKLGFDSNGNATFAGWVYGDRFINSTTSEDPWLKGVNASGTETSYIKKDGTAYFAGNIKMAADKGIQFSPYDETVSSPGSDSNTLDDYEEGTFTPTYKTGAAATNTLSAAGYTTTIGLYTKIGDIVHFQLRLKCSSATAESGQIVIEGLPEAQISTNAQSGAYIVASEMLSASNNARLIIDGSSIIFQNLAGAALNSDTANLDFTKEFHCAGFYKTA